MGKIFFNRMRSACFILLGVVLFGCAAETQWNPGKRIAKDKIKIGVLYISDAVNESSGYSAAHEAGIRIMQRDLGLKDEQVLRRVDILETDPSVTEGAIRELIAQGVNIIVATSWGYMDVCNEMAAEFPHVVFVHCSGIMHNERNFTNYFGRMYQVKYLSGIIAGLKTKTGKIAYVAAQGMENSEVTYLMNAFAIGVESVNKKAQVLAQVTHSWYDPMGEASAARHLIALGCDMLAHGTDSPEPVREAEKAGIPSIAYNTDMKSEGPHTVITSSVWFWDVYYKKLVESVMDGSWTTKPYFGGLDDGVVGLTGFDDALMPPGAARQVRSERNRIARGSFGVFDGVLRTNDGRAIGEAGKTLPDSEITGNTHWYYHNITEVK